LSPKKKNTKITRQTEIKKKN